MKLNRSLKITHLTPLNIFLSITTILLLMKSSSSRLRNPTNPAETSVTHKTIVEANHYMSETDLSTNYNVTNVVKNKPLIFILKEKIIDVKQLS